MKPDVLLGLSAVGGLFSKEVQIDIHLLSTSYYYMHIYFYI